MSVSPAILLVSLAIGVPLMLLALGVLYHAYLYSGQTVTDPLGEHVDSLATESAEDLLMTLQDAVDEMQAQLAHQRDALAGMLSEPRPAFATVAPLVVDEDRPMAAGEFVGQSADLLRDAASTAGGDLRSRITRLAADGLSDRAIARELHIGLEEVRIVRMRGSQS
jgi:hypothetical protein